MTTLIKIPFAQSGDKTIPPATDVSGGVNWTQGYPSAYSKDPATDPSAKRIEREEFNGILFQLSTALNEIQQNGAAQWISPADNGGSAVQYKAGALVSYQGIIWMSLIDNNTGTPSIAGNWMVPAGPAIGDVCFRFKNSIPVIPGAMFMLANGTTISPTSYPHYARTVDATGKIPEYRGTFLRVLDNGAGRDPGRVMDTVQIESVNFDTLRYYGPGSGSGNVTTIALANATGAVYTNGINQASSGGVARAFSPITGETRPTNTAIAAYIRIG